MGKCKFVFFPYKVGHFFSPPSYATRDLGFFTRGWAANWRTHPGPSGPSRRPLPPRRAICARGGPFLRLGSGIEGGWRGGTVPELHPEVGVYTRIYTYIYMYICMYICMYI